MEIRVGDFTVAPHLAAAWLTKHYSEDTVSFYDYAAQDDLDQVRSPRQRVVLEDLGRLVCVGASLTYDRGHTLLAASDGAPWPAREVSSLTGIRQRGEDFYARDDVEALWRLFEYWTGQANLGFGTIAKLLHLKWPHFIPITDDEFRGIYRKRAVDEHNASETLCRDVGGQRRSTANVRAYWAVFHDDLITSGPALDEVRKNLGHLADQAGDGPTGRHANRMAGLSNVRLLDALAWGLGRNDGQLVP